MNSNNEFLIYVHGIGQHSAGYSKPWFAALRPHLAQDIDREEVLWSQIVNPAVMGAAMAAMPDNDEFFFLKNSIESVMHDRMMQQVPENAEQANVMSEMSSDLVSGLSIDDFTLYMVNPFVRAQILDQFKMVVQPHLASGDTLHIISHSWGTVVAYEGLRQLEANMSSGSVRNFFTVGSALSISPVQSNLFRRFPGGARPNMVENWINLDSQWDFVGGVLTSAFDVNLPEHLELDPVGCSSFLGLVSPICAHGSYFDPDNQVTNRDIFADRINE